MLRFHPVSTWGLEGARRWHGCRSVSPRRRTKGNTLLRSLMAKTTTSAPSTCLDKVGEAGVGTCPLCWEEEISKWSIWFYNFHSEKASSVNSLSVTISFHELNVWSTYWLWNFPFQRLTTPLQNSSSSSKMHTFGFYSVRESLVDGESFWLWTGTS